MDKFQPVQLGPCCKGTPLYSTRPLQTWTSFNLYSVGPRCTGTPPYSTRPLQTWISFSLYSLDLIVQGLHCTVQGAPPDMDKFQPVQCGLHHTGTPVCSTGPLQSWISSTCTVWTSTILGPLCAVQGLFRHGQVQPVQHGPHPTGTPLCSTMPLQTWTTSTCTVWTSLYMDHSIQYKGPPDMDKFTCTVWDLVVQGPFYTVQGLSRHG